MKNLDYIYICIKHVAFAFMFVFVFPSVVSAQTKVESSKVEPSLLVNPNQQQEQAKSSSSGEREIVLFPSKWLLEKEKLYDATRSYLAKYKGNNLIDVTIKNMYQPAKLELIQCDLSMPESFDKSALPVDVVSYKKEILKVIPEDALSELYFCLSYLGIRINDTELFTFYVAPYKLNIEVLKRTQLVGRDLAWLIANDFKQSVCEGNPQIYISKDNIQSLEKRMTK